MIPTANLGAVFTRDLTEPSASVPRSYRRGLSPTQMDGSKSAPASVCYRRPPIDIGRSPVTQAPPRVAVTPTRQRDVRAINRRSRTAFAVLRTVIRRGKTGFERNAWTSNTAETVTVVICTFFTRSFGNRSNPHGEKQPFSSHLPRGRFAGTSERRAGARGTCLPDVPV